MKLKSYFRGIGCGMIVAALVMMCAGRERVSEAAEQKETLLETAMINKIPDASANVSSDDVAVIKENMDISSAEEKNPIAVVSDSGKTEFMDITPNEAVETKTEPPFEEESLTEISSEDEPGPSITPIDPHVGEDTGFEVKGETVEIKVIAGDSSVSVSRHLFEAGLVESAVEFDKYLCENGYDKFICVGTYEIVNGADFETIAKTLTKR